MYGEIDGSAGREAPHCAFYIKQPTYVIPHTPCFGAEVLSLSLYFLCLANLGMDIWGNGRELRTCSRWGTRKVQSATFSCDEN